MFLAPKMLTEREQKKTNSIRVPEPLKVGCLGNDDGAFFGMELLPFTNCAGDYARVSLQLENGLVAPSTIVQHQSSDSRQ